MDSVARVLSSIDAEARQIVTEQARLQDSVRVLDLAVQKQSTYVAKLDSQYRILEAERQPLLQLFARSVLTDLRMGRWALLDALLGSENLADFLAKRAAMPRLRTSAQSRAIESARGLIEIRDLEDLSLDETKRLAEGKSQIEEALKLFTEREEVLSKVRKQAEIDRNLLITQQSRLDKSNALLSEQLREKSAAIEQVATMVETTVDKLSSSGTFASLKGLLPWPVDGSLASRFGKKRHHKLETVTENPGIDVATDATKPVHAVAPGTVKTVTWLRGFGNICIVQHEGDHHTVYARLGEVLLKQGDVIDTQTVVGYPGFDTEHENYVVHFEVWAGKEKQDPIAWLAPAKK
ncbi:MAG: peptidoglycan DD-metalloendopeptidase family protein [bacterium]|nr:peptidoglycan DD-metalloendopeptidase family protein [bacterium]